MNKIFKKALVALVGLCFGPLVSAQEGLSVYAEYLQDNYYLLHPAMAGVKNSTQFRLTTRQQWSGVDDAPSLLTFAGSTRLNERSGIGVIAFNDKNGYHSQTGFKATYSHHITFSESRYDLNQLSFGLSAGFARTALDESEFGGFDPTITGGLTVKDSYFSADIGAAYHRGNFFSMLSIKNLVSSKQDMYSDANSNNLRKYLLGAGYDFGNTRYGTGWMYEPSVLVQYTEEIEDVSLDINFKIYRQFEGSRVYAGLSYRSHFNGADYMKNGKTQSERLQYIAPLVGGNFKNVSFSYSYAQLTGDMKISNTGFHMFSFGLNLFPKKSSLNCNCPSVKD